MEPNCFFSMTKVTQNSPLYSFLSVMFLLFPATSSGWPSIQYYVYNVSLISSYKLRCEAGKQGRSIRAERNSSVTMWIFIWLLRMLKANMVVASTFNDSQYWYKMRILFFKWKCRTASKIWVIMHTSIWFSIIIYISVFLCTNILFLLTFFSKLFS